MSDEPTGNAGRLQVGDLIRRRNWPLPAPRHYSALLFTVTEVRERDGSTQYVCEAGNLVAIIDDDQLPEWQRLVVAD
jgi:hypothetical protein